MKRLGVFLVALSVSVGMFGVFGTVAGATHVDPTFVDGNPSCRGLGYEFGFKVDPPDSGTYTVPGVGTITVTADGTEFSWSSTFGIDAVIAKGGPNANVYIYDPPAESRGDSGLTAPDNDGRPFGLSHIEFCYDLAPDLDITKDVSDATVDEGDSFSYTITVENTGDGDATNVVVTDDLDDDLESVSADASQGTCSVGAGNTIECDLGTIAAGADATVTIDATAPGLPLVEGGPCQITVKNTATVESDQTQAATSGQISVTITGTGCETTPPPTTPPPGEITVEIVKTNDADEDGTYTNSEEAPEPGSNVSFHLVITNTSDEVVTITSLTDAFPGTTIDLLDNKCSGLAGVSLDPGDSVECTFSVQNYSPDATADATINTAAVCVENAAGSEACDENNSRVTSAEVLGGTVTRTPTRTPPGGLAFTGPNDANELWMAAAFLLLLFGMTLMYFGSPREEELEG